MREFVLTRLVALVVAVLGTGLFLFVILDLLPSPWASVRGDGLAMFAGPPEFWPRLAVTLPLVLLALLVAAAGGAILSLPMIPRSLSRAIATVLAAVPPFWLGMVLALVFAVALQLFPQSGFVPWSNPAGALTSLALPALALGVPFAGTVALKLPKLGRPEMVEVLGRTFLAQLVGAALVESVFYLPGLGRQVLGAAAQHDLALLGSGLFALSAIAALGLFGFSGLRLLVRPELRR